MKSETTPGPWTEHDGQIYAENDPKGRTFALIPYYDHEPEQDANARLIAAAPELLAACKAWEYARKEGGISHADFFQAAWEKTQSAIAKAEGSDQ